MKTIKNCLLVCFAATLFAASYSTRAAEPNLAGAQSYDEEVLATFHGFGTLTDGGYTATIDGGTIRFASQATWDGNTNGVSVLVRYSGYAQPSANAFLVTLKSSNVGSGAENAVGVFARSTDGTVHGVWDNNTWTGKDGDSSWVQVCNQTLAGEGYMIFTYKGGSGTILYDEEGAIVYKATKLMTQKYGQKIGDLITVGSESATMEIEGVRIFKGMLSAGEIAAAVADFEASEPPDEPTYDWKKWCEDESYTSNPLAKDVTAGKQIKVAFKGILTESDVTSAQLAYFHGDTNDIYLNTDESGYAVLTLHRKTSQDYHSATSTVAIAEGEHQFGLFVRRGTSSGGHVVSIVVTMDGKQLVALGDRTLTFDTNPMRKLYLGDAEKTSNVFTSYYVEPETAVDDDTETIETLITDVKVLFRIPEGPEVFGAACLYDWTFTNTVAMASGRDIAAACGSQQTTALKGDSNAHYTNEVDGVYTALKGYVRPYVNVTISGGQSVAYYGTASAQTNTILFTIGNGTGNFFVATGSKDGEIVLGRMDSLKATIDDSTLVTADEVEDPSATPHLYTVYISADRMAATLSVDGEEIDTKTYESAQTINAGLQISGVFGGKPDNWLREETAAATSAANCLRVFDHELTATENKKLMAEFAPYWPKPVPEITKDESTHTWTVDTTKAAYAFTANEIGELKSTKWQVTLKSASELGAKVDFGSISAAQKSHFVIESGTHAMTWVNGSMNINFTTDATADDPSILVKGDATLNFTVRDFTGWSGSAQNKMGNIVRVNEGGVLNLLQSGSYTHYYQGRYWLDPGATVTAGFSENTFRINGGAVEGSEQLYVPDSTNGSAEATFTVADKLRIHHDNTPGLGIYVGENSRLAVNADITSDGAYPLAKWGAGTLKIDGALTDYTGILTAHAGTLALTQPTLGGGLTMEAGTTLSVLFDGEVTHGTVVLTAQSLDIASGVQLLVNGTNHVYSIDGGNLVIEKAVAEVGGVKYGTITDAVAAAGNGGKITLLVEKEAILSEIDAAAVTLTQVEGNVYTVSFNMTEGAALVITEIMPKPTDAQDRGTLAGMDPNGLESGWVEVENTSGNWADLKDYRFIRVNRGKKTDTAGYGNFPPRLIAPHAKAVFYTSERYANSADMTVSAFATAAESENPTIFTNLHNIVVWPDKVNPKKFPFVRLYYAPGGTIQSTVDTVVIPSDLPEGASIIVEPIEKGKATVRYICEAPTCGTANPSVEGLEELGPNVGPLYEISTQKKHDSSSEFGIMSPAKIGEDYEIEFAFNPTMHPTEAQTKTGKFRDEDAITNILLVYRTRLDDKTLATTNVSMSATWDKGDQGYTYAATIPHAAFDGIGAGQIIQWKLIATDASGNAWTSPSFHNKDDGYEWYGTITEPGELNSAKLPTWHMFVDDESKAQMDTDADKQTLPYNARVAIYDASTSNYYDYVRIDLRGNTSANFSKKSHGLRFAKAHPLTMRDIVSGEDIEEIRKTSLIGEPADPSYMRQMIAFWLLNKAGSPAPFDFPVRCNLNGAFYQLAFNSERFTDELIEDVYKLDKYGYSYKNVGTLKSGGGTTAGGIEKKTPDDEDESNITVLQDELRSKITAAQQVGGTTAEQLDGTDATGLDNAALTKFVVEKFDLPAWLNYLAITRITQEMDDVWANLSIYYDNPEMKEGARGTGTWMPLGYDMNISFGQYYHDAFGARGLIADYDWFKGHPFYGGNRVRCYKDNSFSGTVNFGNDGFEAVWQSAKFRRLYLRRLRTLMDQELKAPGTDESEVPLMVKMRELAELMRGDTIPDKERWPHSSSGTGVIDAWGSNWPATIDLGIDDLWNNYIKPRQTHLYVTHSVTNASVAVGYGAKCNAGIPEAQSPIAELKGGFSAAFDATDGVTVISNTNDEAVDMSGWKLEGPMTMTLPAGTVVDANDVIFIVTDRRAYVAAQKLTDQVIVGNAEAGEGEADIVLKTADDIVVIAPVVKSEQEKYLRLWGFCGAPDGGDADKGEFIIFTNLNDEVALDATMANIWIHKTGEVADKCHFDLPEGSVVPAGGFLRLEQTWKKITDGDVNIYLTASNGVSIYAKVGLSQKNLGVKETGYYAVYDVATDSWGKQLIVQSPGYVLPVTPGQPTTYESEEVATNAAAKAVVLRPENEVTNVISAADYNALFNVRAVQTAMSTWELVTELKPAVSNEVQAAIDEALTNATLMATLTTDEPTASVQTQAGLYYGMAAGEGLGVVGCGLGVGQWVLGTGGKQELKADKPSDAKGFYQIRVQVEPPEIKR